MDIASSPVPTDWSMIGLVVSDVDGTILSEDKTLAPQTVAAVRRMAAAGVPLTLLSARPPSGLRPLADALGLAVAYGAFNGGTIMGPDGAIAQAHTIDPATARRIAGLIAGSGAGLWVFAGGLWYASDLAHRLIARERRSSFIDPLPLADLGAGMDRADKLVAVCDDWVLAERLEQEGAGSFAGQAQVSRSQPFYCDFTHPLAEKGRGLAALAERAGVPLGRTVTFGDGNNDIPMLRASGVSFAMGQAGAGVKAAATFVTASNDEHGVAAGLDFILRQLGHTPEETRQPGG